MYIVIDKKQTICTALVKKKITIIINKKIKNAFVDIYTETVKTTIQGYFFVRCICVLNRRILKSCFLNMQDEFVTFY